MRVAYVYYLLFEGQLGIESKIRQQLQAIDAIGWDDLDILVLNPSRNARMDQVRYVKLPHRFFAGRYVEHIFRRFRLIDRAVDLRAYDYVILRYPLADMTGPAFAGRHRVITEHHANEAAELVSRLAQARVPERMVRRLLLSMENRYAPRTLRNCRGIIAVTDEIRAFESERAGGTVPSKTIANGIDVAGVPHSGFRRFDGRHLDLVFVITNYRPWHGLERIVDSIHEYGGRVKVRLQLIGNVLPQQINSEDHKLESIVFHGPRTGRELDDVMANAHLAVSTLSLHRKGMKEASSLKTREYTARGLPFILAYDDPDLVESDAEIPFFLKFRNDDSLLDVERIVDFAVEVSRRQQEVVSTMRTYALEHMDWRVKFQEYLRFIDEIERIEQKTHKGT